jgi:hypothetical protein
MTIRYGNDIELTEFAMQAELEFASMKAYLRDGNLDAVFLRAHSAGNKLEKLKERLNSLKYGRLP